MLLNSRSVSIVLAMLPQQQLQLVRGQVGSASHCLAQLLLANHLLLVAIVLLLQSLKVMLSGLACLPQQLAAARLQLLNLQRQ
jgi:hypothetical protein